MEVKALVIGGNGFIGSHLVKALCIDGVTVTATTRQTLDLLQPYYDLPQADVIYICAAKTRFIECEDDRDAYRVNVDAPIQIAREAPLAKIVYLSSEAVERALHTNYGMHKALAEMGLWALTDPIIVRLSKVEPGRVEECCGYLAALRHASPGIFRWPND